MFLVIGIVLTLPIPIIMYRATVVRSVPHLMLVLGEMGLVAAFVHWLWRRSPDRGTVAASGVAAIFAVAASIPVLGWTLLALALVICHSTRRLLSSTNRMPGSAVDSARASETPPRVARPATGSRHDSHLITVDSKLLEVKPIDDLARPYERLLLCERLLRASLALTLVQMPLNFPSALYEAWLHDASAVEYAVMVVAWLFVTLLGGVALWLIYATLRGFSRGSRRVAWASATTAIVVIPWGVYGWFLEATAEQIHDGTIWVFLLARLEQASVFVLAGIVGAILVRHSEICRLRNQLPGKYLTVWRLCGVIKPIRHAWRVLIDKPFALSVCALLLDGTGFYGYNQTASWLREDSKAFAAFVPTAATTLEAHYLYVTGLSMLVIPLMFLWMRGALAAAEWVRLRARRSAVMTAEQALTLDARAPVLFLRPFADDHVSLSAVVVPTTVKLLNPERERMDLEDLLDTCLSLGPIIALGRPHDGSPPVGVPRAYAGTDWKPLVTTLMDKASLIVLAISDSEGIWWEFDQLTAPNNRGRSLIVVPPRYGRDGHLLSHMLSQLTGSKGDSSVVAAIGRAEYLIGVLPDPVQGATALTAREVPTRAYYDIVLHLALQRRRLQNMATE